MPRDFQAQVTDFGRALRVDLKKVNVFCEEREVELLTQKKSITSAFDEIAPGTERSREKPDKSVENAFKGLTLFSKEVDSLRNYIVLNYMAVIKIVKKRNKNVDPLFDGQINAQSILLSQHFYRSRVVADLVTFTELMTLKHNPSSDKPEKANFMCGVCLETLNNPVVLTCGHRFCFSCAVRCTAQNVIEEEVVQCPSCRKQGPCQASTFKVDTAMTAFLIKTFGVGDEAEAKKILSRQLLPELPDDFKPSKINDVRWTMKCLPSPPRPSEADKEDVIMKAELPETAAAANGLIVLGTTTDTPDLGPQQAPVSLASPRTAAMAQLVANGVTLNPNQMPEALNGIQDDILADMDLNFLLESGAFEGDDFVALGTEGSMDGSAVSHALVQEAVVEPHRASDLSRLGTRSSVLQNITPSPKNQKNQESGSKPVTQKRGRRRSVNPPPQQDSQPPSTETGSMHLQAVGGCGAVGISPLEGTELLDDISSFETRVGSDDLAKKARALIEAAPGTARGKKRPLPGIDQAEENNMYLPKGSQDIKEKNRLAAKRFRHRRETYLAELEKMLSEIEGEADYLQRLEQALIERNATLRQLYAHELQAGSVP